MNWMFISLIAILESLLRWIKVLSRYRVDARLTSKVIGGIWRSVSDQTLAGAHTRLCIQTTRCSDVLI